MEHTARRLARAVEERWSRARGHRPSSARATFRPARERAAARLFVA